MENPLHATRDEVAGGERSHSRRLFIGSVAGVAVAGIAGWRTLDLAGSSSSSENSVASALPGRRVWGHMAPQGLPDYEVFQGNPYGTDRPLDMRKGGWTGKIRPEGGLARAVASGLNAMQILQYEATDKGSSFVVEWFDMADPTWAGAAEGFWVAPCIYPRTVGGFVRMVEEYVTAAQGHPSAATVAGAHVIYVYGGKALTAAQWTGVHTSLSDRGVQVFLVGDLPLSSSQHDYKIVPSALDGMTCFDAAWLFDDGTGRIFASLVPMLQARGIPFAGGLMPGYCRETKDGGYLDPRGTKEFREQWELNLAGGTHWVNVITWNDVSERTDIKANTDWNITRQEVNAYYSARLRGLPQPTTTAELFLTTPDFIVLGEPVLGEALVINCSSETVTVEIRLVDRDGKQVGRTARAVIAPGQIGDATTALDEKINTFPAGRFLRAQAWILEAGGEVRQQVTSAPVVIYTEGPCSADIVRRHYYSVPASRYMNKPVQFTVDGDPTKAPEGVAGVAQAPPGIAPRFLEIIQNTRSVKVVMEEKVLEAQLPMSPRTIVGNQLVSPLASGFYLARVIDEEGMVAYSDPVYFDEVCQAVVG